MRRQERAERIGVQLDELYPKTAPPLNHQDPYSLLIAVLLSARCTDARVNTVTPALFARAATPQAMVQVPVEEIREMIRPCGLSPTKSRNIAALSRLLLERQLLASATKRWSARPTALVLEDGQATATVEVWKHKARPRARTYRVAGRIEVGEDGVCRLADVDVGRVDRRGPDLLSGSIRKRLEGAVRRALVEQGVPCTGDLRVGARFLHWRARQVRAEDHTLQVWLDVE